MSHDGLTDQSTHTSSSQTASHSMSHGTGSIQATANAARRVAVGDVKETHVENVSVEQVPQTEAENQNENATLEINSGEIEMAEEATSEMAFQTLHQSAVTSRHDSGSQESSLPSQEIPLEDLSRKNRSKKKQLSRARLTKTRLSAELRHDQIRSQSQSPKRTIKSDDALKVQEMERVRSSSLTETSQKEHTVPSRRAHSDSSPLRSGIAPSQGKKKKSVSTQVQTKIVLERDIKHPEAKKKGQLEMDVDKGVVQSPKTLIPSQSPAVSLVPEVEKECSVKLTDAPKLVPPAEPDRIRSVSDASLASIEDTASVGSTSSDSQDQFGFHSPSQAEPELSHARAEVKQANNKDLQATTEQLTKLAQMVQEHYKFEKEEETEFTEEIKK